MLEPKERTEVVVLGVRFVYVEGDPHVRVVAHDAYISKERVKKSIKDARAGLTALSKAVR
jgi:hypothetical protein